jgi:hypothetical protein
MRDGSTIVLGLPIGFAVLGWLLAIQRKGNKKALAVVVVYNALSVLFTLEFIGAEAFPEMTQFLVLELALSPLIGLLALLAALIYKRNKVASAPSQTGALPGETNIPEDKGGK